MPYVNVNDIQMYYEIQGDGEPLVLIIGLGTDISEWDGIIGWLAKKYKVLAFDNRGAGRTDKPDAKRFNELGRLIPDASQRMLTQHLRELERDGLVHREVYREVPPRVEYSLTELGHTLKSLLEQMQEWAEQHMMKEVVS